MQKEGRGLCGWPRTRWAGQCLDSADFRPEHVVDGFGHSRAASFRRKVGNTGEENRNACTLVQRGHRETYELGDVS